MSTPQKVSVVLSNTNDWDEWMEVVKVHALVGEVWEYIDPSKDQVPILVEPKLPRPEDIHPEATSYRQLSTEEKDDYKMLRQDYKLDLDRYTRKRNALSSLCKHIQSTVSRSCLFYTYGAISARQMLVELQKRLQPTDQLRELELSRKYNKLKKTPKNQDITEWLYTWEKVYHECHKINLPDVQQGRAVRDFLSAVSSIAPEFAAIWSAEAKKARKEGKAQLDLFEVVEEYRDYRRQFAERDQNNQSAFSITLQEQPQTEKTQEKTPEKKDCLCGEPHRFKDCPYLIPEKQPQGWKPDPAIQERIETKLKNPRLKAAVEYAQASQKEKKKDIPEGIDEIETF
jgi:hypothetical protein